MELVHIAVTDAIATLIETANYDGQPVTPYCTVQCPVCSAVAIIVWAHQGGYERHLALRCMADAQHNRPVLSVRGQFIAARYMHDRYVYEVVPA